MLAAAVLAAAAAPARAQVAGETLKVCADPNNLPFSNRAEEGFENKLARIWAREAGVELRVDARTRALAGDLADSLSDADEDDWGTEYLALILAVKVVDSLDDAVAHIRRYGSGHTEAIVTRSQQSAQRFTHSVDAAAVVVNASTRFTDGGEFGFGAEIGISTQKLHARGPMGLPELTSTKYVLTGAGQTRE